MMIDKEYRELAETTSNLQEHFISIVAEEYNIIVKHAAWLHLMGLMETSDLIE